MSAAPGVHAAAAPDAAHAGSIRRIGPNAITQLRTVLLRELGRDRSEALFCAAGLPDALDHPPESMVDERDVARLHQCVRRDCESASELLADAGDATGAYILVNRIPAPAVRLLKWLPASAAAPLLQKAIQRHAWTFVGSGTFGFEGRLRAGTLTAVLGDNPVVAGESGEGPLCAWHAAVFRRLFAELVAPGISVVETECCAAGAPACRFAIDLTRD